MSYILVCAVLASGFVVLAELLGRAADRIGLSDRLFRLFDLPAEKESAPTVGAAEGTKIILFDEIVSRKGGAVK